ncbi:MAG: hypothetical protein Q8873_00260 [Bacillota bacterium]|nr:hypothetical protein [Bacillota bacterium]
MKHTVKINVAGHNGEGIEILRTRKMSIPKKIIRFIFGEFCEVMVLTPGKTVLGVEICELPQSTSSQKRGEPNE